MIPWAPGRSVPATVHAGSPGVLLAPGAGTDQHHPLVTGLVERLVAGGLGVITFDFPYRAEGRGAPDRPDVLMACQRAAVGFATDVFGAAPIIGGRSMGGRIATLLAAAPDAPPIAGVVAYAYPLHPAGKPERLRVEHLGGIACEVLMVVGDRDTMCTPELYDRHVRPLPNVTTHVLAGADHSWRVLKRSGRTPDDVFDEAAAATLTWTASQCSSPRERGDPCIQ